LRIFSKLFFNGTLGNIDPGFFTLYKIFIIDDDISYGLAIWITLVCLLLFYNANPDSTMVLSREYLIKYRRKMLRTRNGYILIIGIIKRGCGRLKNSVKICLLLLLLMLTLRVSVFSSPDIGENYWPKESWRTSTPEAQGMDSERIYAMLKSIKDNSLDIQSVLIIRNGYLVTESYFAPCLKGRLNNIYSCTKSFTSALIGIAIREGYIKDIHQKVIDFFPGYTFKNLDSRKKVITIENLLSMTAGLDWVEPSPGDHRDPHYTRDLIPMTTSKDPIRYILDHSMADEPGSRFYYNTGVSHLLSAIIQKTSGTSTLNFAIQHLFQPLGITDFNWDTDSLGIPWGGMNLFLSPEEMARFGYLYLRHGVWEGKQIVPAEWVETSTKEHSSFNPSPNEKVSYGYQWWIDSYGYHALGFGGQYIYVIPGLDMVVVFTNGNIHDSISYMAPILVEKFILPAVKSDKPLPPNTTVAKKMKKLLKVIEAPGK
jgi:CubicO group peptidase (beta-lactamase class C family)